MHSILEKVLTSQIKLTEAVSYFIDNYSKEVNTDVSRSIRERDYILCSEYLAQIQEKKQCLEKYCILEVEEKHLFNIGKFKFTGIIDLLLKDKDTEDLIIVDHKSAKYPLKQHSHTVMKNMEQVFEKHKTQLYLYSKPVYEKHGKYPKKLCWNHFKSGKTASIDFDEDEYAHALQWVENTIHRIEQDALFMPEDNYFYCTHLCGCRKECEYQYENRKLYSDTYT